MKQNIELEEHERQRCEVWTRVMGYHRPVSQFNAGKQSEHRERKFYVESVKDSSSCHPGKAAITLAA